MLQAIYIFLGFLALLTTGAAFTSRLPIDVKVGASAAAFVLWTIWGFAGYDVEVVTDGGTIIHNQYVTLVLIGLLAAAVLLANAIWHIMGMFGMDPKRLLKVRV